MLGPQASNRESKVILEMAGILTCNSYHHPSRLCTVDIKRWYFCVTYSCATVRDFHTIPF